MAAPLVNLGPKASYKTFPPTTYNAVGLGGQTGTPDSLQAGREEAGMIMYTYDTTNGIRGWRFNKQKNTTAAGDVCYYTDGQGVAQYSNASADSIAGDNGVCGIAVAAITASNYGWVQFLGYCATVTTKSGVSLAVGDIAKASSDATGTIDKTVKDTAPTNVQIGICVVATSAGVTGLRLTLTP